MGLAEQGWVEYRGKARRSAWKPKNVFFDNICFFHSLFFGLLGFIGWHKKKRRRKEEEEEEEEQAGVREEEEVMDE